MKYKNYKDKLAQILNQLPTNLHPIISVTLPFYLFHKEMYQGLEMTLQDHLDLSSSEMDVMVTLLSSEDQTLSPTQLYRSLLFSSGGMTKVLKKLETKQLICRLDNPDDKRSKLVQLTKQGEKYTRKAFQLALENEAESLSGLDNEELQQLSLLLNKLLAKKIQ